MRQKFAKKLIKKMDEKKYNIGNVMECHKDGSIILSVIFDTYIFDYLILDSNQEIKIENLEQNKKNKLNK